MSLNWVEIDRVLGELPLAGCHLQNVRQADYHHLYFEFYRPGGALAVLVSLSPRQTRLHSVGKRPPTLRRAPRFTEFLKARLLGCTLVESRQLGQERLVLWRFVRDGEEFLLWIRLWGGAANILVTDSHHLILDVAFRRPASGEVAGQRFDPESTIGPSSGKVFLAREFTELEGLPPDSSYNRRVEVAYSLIPALQVDALRDQALRLAERRLLSLAQAREKSQAKARDFARKDDFKLYGDVLTADLWKIEKGATSFDGQDWRDGTDFRLALDPKLAPHEHAQVWYRKYQKARDGQDQLAAELAGQDAEEERWRTALEQIPEFGVDEVQGFLDKHRVAKVVQKTTDKEPRPGLEFTSGPWTIWVGRNARENDRLLRRYVRGNDLWLHTRDVPGGYVFIRAVKGKSVPLDVLLDAGNLAVWYSRAKGEGRADLYYTAVKYLRRAQNGPLGLVLPTQEKNLNVVVDPLRMERLRRDVTENEEA